MRSIERFRPRLLGSAVLGVALLMLLPQSMRFSTRCILAWDSATALYLLLAARMMARSDTKAIFTRAAEEDDGRIIILLLATVSALASIAAITVELASAKMPSGGHIHWQLVALTALTVILSWLFLHTSFALHYAHEFYTDRNRDGVHRQGLDFPGQRKPDYWDFVYYSFIIGTAAATADVNITCTRIRRVSTVHCIVAFFFNTTIVGLTVNIAASLF